MKEKVYIGVDQSLSNSGLCVIDENEDIIYTSSIPIINPAVT